MENLNCMKCGRELEQPGAFCPDCLHIMQQYPVKQGTPVQLPRREISAAAVKASRRRVITPEEQVVRQRTVIHRQRMLLLTVLLLLGIFVYLYFTQEPILPQEVEKPAGQNYTVDSTEDSTGEDVSQETVPSLTLPKTP